MKKKKRHLGILYPAKLFFKYEGKIKIFQDKETEAIHCQQTCLTRNTERNPLG